MDVLKPQTWMILPGFGDRLHSFPCLSSAIGTRRHRLLLIGLLYGVPLMIVMGVLIGPGILMQAVAQNHDALRELGGIFSGFASCLIAPLSLAVALWMPAALLFAVVERSFGAAFDFA